MTTLTFDLTRNDGKFEVYRLDAERDGELVDTVTDTVFTLPNQSCILLCEI